MFTRINNWDSFGASLGWGGRLGTGAGTGDDCGVPGFWLRCPDLAVSAAIDPQEDEMIARAQEVCDKCSEFRLRLVLKSPLTHPPFSDFNYYESIDPTKHGRRKILTRETQCFVTYSICGFIYVDQSPCPNPPFLNFIDQRELINHAMLNLLSAW